MTTDDGKNWNRSDLLLKQRGKEIIAAAFSADGKTGLVAGRRISAVLMTKDGGQNWKSSSLKLKDTEWVDEAALSKDGRVGLVAGDKGSVLMTKGRWAESGTSVERKVRA